MTVDAGQGFFAVEEQLLRGVFRDGYRSDVMALLLQHWIEHPPDGIWMKKRWRKPLGVDWPEQRLPIPEDASPSEDESTIELGEGSLHE